MSVGSGSRTMDMMSDFGPRFYILDADGNPVRVPDALTWGRWFEKAERHVAWTEIGEWTVSTVFLGLDHNYADEGPPVLFETMILGPEVEIETISGRRREVPDFLDFQTRCGTRAEAKEMHEAACAVLRVWLAQSEAETARAIGRVKEPK